MSDVLTQLTSSLENKTSIVATYALLVGDSDAPITIVHWKRAALLIRTH